MSRLDYIELETRHNPDAAVIWLHGLGASGHDFEPVVPELQLPANAGIRFLFPHAPEMAVTINGGMRMPAWYDIKSLELGRSIDTQQLRDSAQAVAELVEQEVARGIPSERIIIAGFSQGGAVAYELGLSYPQRLAGILALSSYFATAESVQPSDANRDIPISVFHGTHDPMIPEKLGRDSVEKLRAMGYQADYHSYPMDHSVCLEEIQEIGAFLRKHLNL
ncbi:phospholipase/carboxylesterase [Marinobacter daqiaonensis]|uniref:Phospholipase/carboxylesterase n=1 Tax=Marinobacter daqiaonensis TaxID=650891 RepID=A0A1I6GS69_9GAMM|nr:dienelactone hydrolase family protein [Marinobacter daqiaonensis]SFR44907.1 phospholipase/carboxylesterase [Marinobacter daqiaonensis]